MSMVPRPPSGFGDILRFCREVFDYLCSREDVIAPGTLLNRTTRGTSRSALGGDGGAPGETGLSQFKGQWVATTSYLENDLVHCDQTTEREEGTQAGFYRCIGDITGDPGNGEPSVDTSHWLMESRGHWDYLFFRSGNRTIEVDLRTTYKLKIYNSDDATPGSCTIDLNDIPEDAGNKEIKFREITGKDTDTGGCFKMVVLGSNWYL